MNLDASRNERDWGLSRLAGAFPAADEAKEKERARCQKDA